MNKGRFINVSTGTGATTLKIWLYPNDLLSNGDVARLVGMAPISNGQFVLLGKKFEPFIFRDRKFSVPQMPNTNGRVRNFVRVTDLPKVLKVAEFSPERIQRVIDSFKTEEKKDEEIRVDLEKSPSPAPFKKRFVHHLEDEEPTKRSKSVVTEILMDLAETHGEEVRRVILDKLGKRPVGELLDLI